MAATSGPRSTETHIKDPNYARGNVFGAMRNYETRASVPTPQVRISDSIKHDHAELKAFADRIFRSTDPDEQTRYQNQFTWELARHAVGEELVVYPALEKHLRDGEELAEKDRREHQGVKDELQVFQGLKSTDPRFIPTLKALMEDLSHHIDEEETVDLAKLEEALSKDDSIKLTQSFDRTKYFSPTRAHPMSPQKPPFESASGLLSAPMDYLADMFRKWPEDGKTKAK